MQPLMHRIMQLRFRPERVFLAIAIPLAICYLLIIKPFELYPHGPERFLHVSYMAHIFAGGEAGTLPSSFLRVVQGLPDPAIYCQKFEASSLSTWDKLGCRLKHLPALWHLREIALEPGQVTTFHTSKNAAAYSPVAYAPQLLAETLGIYAGLPPVYLFYLAAFATGISMMALGYYIIKIFPIYKWALTILLLFPALFFHRSLVIPDAFTIHVCLLFIACALYIKERGVILTHAKLAGFLALSVLIGLNKSVYVGVPLIMALIPAQSFGNSKRKMLIIAAIFLCGFIASYGWSSYILSAYADDNRIWSMDLFHKRLGKIAEEPGRYISYMAGQLISGETYTAWYENHMLWLVRDFIADMPFPVAFFYYAWILLALSQALKISPLERLFCTGIFFGTCLVIVIFLQLTHFKAGLFQGGFVAQGRYFLPVFPFLWLGLGKSGWLPPQASRALIFTLLIGVVILNALVIYRLIATDFI